MSSNTTTQQMQIGRKTAIWSTSYLMHHEITYLPTYLVDRKIAFYIPAVHSMQRRLAFDSREFPAVVLDGSIWLY